MSVFSELSPRTERTLVAEWGNENASDSDILVRFKQLALPLAILACAVSGLGLGAAFAQKNQNTNAAKLLGGGAAITALAALPLARKIRVISPAWHAVQIHNRLEDVSRDFDTAERKLNQARSQAPAQAFPALVSEHALTAQIQHNVESAYLRLICKAGVQSVPSAYRCLYTRLQQNSAPQ